MNKRDLQTWLDRYSSELSPEDWKTLQQLLQEADSNPQSEDSLQRFLKVEHFFNEWHKQRYQQNLDLSLSEKNELRERLRKLDHPQEDTRQTGAKQRRLLPMYWIGGVAAAILLLILFKMPTTEPDYDSDGPMVIQNDDPGERQSRSIAPEDNTLSQEGPEATENPDQDPGQEGPVQDPKPGEHAPELTQKPIEELYATNFEPNMVLDGLIEDPFRDDSNALASKPPMGDTLKQNLEFSLKNTPAQDFIIEVLSNQNQVVLSDTLRGSKQDYVPNTQNLAPGLYYWKVYKGDDMIGIGKFYWVP